MKMYVAFPENTS